VKTNKYLMSSSDSDSRCDKVEPVDTPKISKIFSSNSFITVSIRKLQVIALTSRFAHINVYSLVSDDLIDLFDDSNDSNEDRQRIIVESMKKNKRRRRRLLRAVKRQKRSLNQERASVNKCPTNPLETAKQDMADQEKNTNNNFTGVGSLHVFREDLRTEALARRGWMSLLTIQLADGSEVSILDNYMLLAKFDLKSGNRF